MFANFEHLRPEIADRVQALNLELIDCQWVMEQGRHVLRLVIDQPQGEEKFLKNVSVEDCARVSRALNPWLEEHPDLKLMSYHLEVSSPGINRPLKRLEDFQANVGKVVKITLQAQQEGRQNFKGILTQMNKEGSLFLWIDGKTFELSITKIRDAHLDYFATQELLKKT